MLGLITMPATVFASHSFHSGQTIPVHNNEAAADLDGQNSPTELEVLYPKGMTSE